MNKLRIGTVFSGIGAFEFALKRLHIEHEILFACDNGEREIDYNCSAEFEKVKQLKTPIEKCEYVEKLYASKTSRKNYVKESYLANYQIKDNLFYEDIKLLDGIDFRNKIDIFVGGSPCQSFSSVGFQHGLDDARGTLFYEFARLIKEIKPKVFIYENVRNLINHDKGRTWETIKDIFESLGYDIKYSILNAADHGIPQNRRRLFVVGFKDNVDFVFPKNVILEYDMHQFLESSCCYPNFTHNSDGTLLVKNKKGDVPKEFYLSPCLYRYVMKGGTKSFYQKPEINKKVARTLLKTMGNRHRAGIDNYVSDDLSDSFGKVRMLTQREAHRLMGFTDDYKIVVSRAQAYKQAGNSIVVDVMMDILKQICSFYKELLCPQKE